jgi:diacylglycerol kinase (ATP)
MHLGAIRGPGNSVRPLAVFEREAKAEWTSTIEQADAIAVFGGDGTVHRHLRALIELDVPLLVVPCGSGNDFARALGLRHLGDSVRAWHQFTAGAGNVRTIDLGVIHESTRLRPIPAGTVPGNCHYFSSVAGVGLDADVSRRVNSLPRWIRAHGGYGLSALRELLRFEPVPMSIYLGDKQASRFEPTTLVAVANASAYGGGMKIAPRAQLDDGKLDFCIVRGMNRFHLLCLFPTVYFGRHIRSSKVEYVQSLTARIETAYPVDVYADGEYVCQTPVEFSVARKALQVIVPASSVPHDTAPPGQC